MPTSAPQRQPSRRFVAAAIALALLVFAALVVGGVRLVRSAARPATKTPDSILAASVPSVLPAAPFAVAAPPAPPAEIDGQDVNNVDPSVLTTAASRAARRGQWDRAALLEHWAVMHEAGDQYDLACYESRAGHVDAAIYWLQRAAREEGVDARWADEDPDLRSVRDDGRWTTIRAFLVQATRYWAGQRVERTLVIVPAGYAVGRPIPVVVGLHGMGSVPDDFAGPWAQTIADALGVGFVAVSGTQSLGPDRFRWAESPEQDLARIDEALAQVRDRVTIAEGQIVLLGFSQGAQMSLEIAARRPDEFAGAIAMSPGTISNRGLDGIARSADLSKRRFVVVAGARENPRTPARVRADAADLRALGSDVFARLYPDMNTHSFPPDFEEALPRWIGFVVGAGGRPAGQTF